MVMLSDAVIEGMGFRRIRGDEKVIARFSLLHVFEIQGFTLNTPALTVQTSTLKGVTSRYSVGTSVNAICQELVSDDFVESEDSWRRDNNSTPPYLIVQFGPTSEQSYSGQFVRFTDKEITTYEGFSKPRVELSLQANEILPLLITGWSSSFSDFDFPVRFIPLGRAFAGMSGDGRVVHDLALRFSASGYGSRRVADEDALDRFEQGATSACSIKPKAAKFFHLGHVERDPLRKFLYLFLAIEIKTHDSFASIKCSEAGKIVNAPSRLIESTTAFHEAMHKNCKTLKDRFFLCALHIWPSINDADLTSFRQLKRVRDEIAHGVLAEPPAQVVEMSERLARKIMPLP